MKSEKCNFLQQFFRWANNMIHRDKSWMEESLMIIIINPMKTKAHKNYGIFLDEGKKHTYRTSWNLQ
jgi:hypothetical protein